jgi:hypothetical protein
MARTCEYLPDGPLPCGCIASFRVSRGRKYDAQDSCRRHLAGTVTALIGLEDRAVTVEVIRANDTGNVLRQSKCASGGPSRETEDDDDPVEPYCVVCGLRVNVKRRNGKLTHEAMADSQVDADHAVQLNWRKAAQRA